MERCWGSSRIYRRRQDPFSPRESRKPLQLSWGTCIYITAVTDKKNKKSSKLVLDFFIRSLDTSSNKSHKTFSEQFDTNNFFFPTSEKCERKILKEKNVSFLWSLFCHHLINFVVEWRTNWSQMSFTRASGHCCTTKAKWRGILSGNKRETQVLRTGTSVHR